VKEGYLGVKSPWVLGSQAYSKHEDMWYLEGGNSVFQSPRAFAAMTFCYLETILPYFCGLF